CLRIPSGDLENEIQIQSPVSSRRSSAKPNISESLARSLAVGLHFLPARTDRGGWNPNRSDNLRKFADDRRRSFANDQRLATNDQRLLYKSIRKLNQNDAPEHQGNNAGETRFLELIRAQAGTRPQGSKADELHREGEQAQCSTEEPDQGNDDEQAF